MATRLDAEKFTGKNDYGLWKMKMKAILIDRGLAAALAPIDKGKAPVLDEKAQAKFDEMLQRAHSAVILCLGDKVLREVQEATTAVEILQKLDEVYLAKSLANRLYMKKRLYSYSFVEGRSIIEQLEEFNKIIDDLGSVDVKISDEDKAILTLNALPSSFDQLSDAIIYGRDKPITYSEVHAALMAKELQKGTVRSADVQAAEALNIKKFKKPKFKKKFEETKASSSDGTKESRSCHWCKKPGHLKKDCFAWKKKQASEGKNLSSSDCVEGVDPPPQLMNVVDRKVGTSWIMDSGCSFHMCPNKNWFHELEEASGTVLLGNNHICKIRGVGKVKLKLQDGSIKILTDVRFIPEVKRNLISLGMLELKGFTIMMAEGKMLVKLGQQVVMKAERENSLYYLAAKAVDGESHSATDDTLEIWHKRLGHPAEGSVKELIRKGLIPGDSSSKLEPCEQCILGKAKKAPFPTGIHSSAAPLDYIHSDLWGPAPVNSVGGGRYYLSIIDDYTRNLWIYILKEKSETFSKFKLWCNEVELEKGRKVKCLRTDNGLEFLSKEFDLFCKEKGIKRHRTVPCNPQQNGVAERMNRTILERVRCLLLASGLSSKFWGEAVYTAAYLINKCPSSAIKSETPDHLWHGIHGDYTKYKVFGCAAYAHVRKSKLEARALKCIMLGYQKGVKGYRLWCIEPGNQKVIISRDVVFVEAQMPYLSQDKNSDAASSDLFRVGSGSVSLEAGGASDSDSESEPESGGVSSQGGGNAETEEDLSNYQLTRDRVRRKNVKAPDRYSQADVVYYALCAAEDVEQADPLTYKEAMQSKDRKKWIEAMNEEIDSLIKNKTWVLVDKSQLKQGSQERKLVSCKWIFKKKIETTGEENIRFKARLVARGFTQVEGIDYKEVFAPVVKHTSIRILLAVVNQRNWELQQLDVKTAFLNGDLEETIFMEQPEGYISEDGVDKICLLKKSLYGLKQSPRQWNKKFNEQMMLLGFHKSKYDDCIYIKKKGNTPVAYLLLYVDDMLLAGPSVAEIQTIKEDLKNSFEMKDLGEAKKILGMDISRNRNKKQLWLSQSEYIEKLLKKFHMADAKATATPLSQSFKLSKEQAPKTEQEALEMESVPYSSVVGSIMYTMICTRPDLAHAISVTSRYMSDPGKEHWIALKWILRYLRSSSNCGIVFKGSDKVGEEAVGYCDADYATNLDNRKSQSGFLFTLFGSVVSWKSSLQNVVALSTTEAEYMALTSAVQESFWIQGVISDFGIQQETMVVFCDSSSAMCLARHQFFHERSKHIDVRLHFIRDEVEKGRVKVVKIDTLHNPADMLTKVLGRDKFEHCKSLISVCSMK